MIRNKFLFYFLSFTWGLPMTLIGCIVAVVLRVAGYKPKGWGHCYYFEIGKGWGGLELGVFFLASKNPSERTLNHEHGHAFHNCWFGPLMPFVVCIPSVTRYWYRKIRKKAGRPCKTKYDSVWFEGSATNVGTKFINSYTNNTK